MDAEVNLMDNNTYDTSPLHKQVYSKLEVLVMKMFRQSIFQN